MNCSILYVYDKNPEGETVLLGAEIKGIDGKLFNRKGIYVGIPFVLEDFSSEINRKAVGIDDMKLFEERYNAVDAKGVILFPQTSKYAFLEEGDSVVIWNGNERIEEYLDNALMDYKTDKTSINMSERIASLDADDPFVELYGGISRSRVSNR